MSDAEDPRPSVEPRASRRPSFAVLVGELPSLSLRSVVAALLAAALVGGVVGGLVELVRGSRFEARSSVLVQWSPSDVLPLLLNGTADPVTDADVADVAGSVPTQPVLALVADRLDDGTGVADLREAVTATPVVASHLVTVTVHDGDRERAQQVADLVAQSLVTRQRQEVTTATQTLPTVDGVTPEELQLRAELIDTRVPPLQVLGAATVTRTGPTATLPAALAVVALALAGMVLVLVSLRGGALRDLVLRLRAQAARDAREDERPAARSVWGSSPAARALEDQLAGLGRPGSAPEPEVAADAAAPQGGAADVEDDGAEVEAAEAEVDEPTHVAAPVGTSKAAQRRQRARQRRAHQGAGGADSGNEVEEVAGTEDAHAGETGDAAASDRPSLDQPLTGPAADEDTDAVPGEEPDQPGPADAVAAAERARLERLRPRDADGAGRGRSARDAGEADHRPAERDVPVLRLTPTLSTASALNTMRTLVPTWPQESAAIVPVGGRALPTAEALFTRLRDAVAPHPSGSSRLTVFGTSADGWAEGAADDPVLLDTAMLEDPEQALAEQEGEGGRPQVFVIARRDGVWAVADAPFALSWLQRAHGNSRDAS